MFLVIRSDVIDIIILSCTSLSKNGGIFCNMWSDVINFIVLCLWLLYKYVLVIATKTFKYFSNSVVWCEQRWYNIMVRGIAVEAGWRILTKQ